MAKTNRSVVFVLFDACLLIDFSGPLQVFEIGCETAEAGSSPYQLIVCSPKGGLVRTSSGVEVMTSSFAECDRIQIDTLVVGGGPGVQRAAADPDVVGWLRRKAKDVRRICSVCTGTFVLAAAGVLQNRRAVTHWGACELLADRYPDIDVHSDPIFLRDGKIWTSAGATAGIDLALALLEDDLGRHEAMRVARRLVIFLKRPGGQAQFSVPLAIQTREDEVFEGLSVWIQSNLDKDLRVDVLAEKAGMSPRTFARVFSEKTGRTPAKVVEEFRVEAARRTLEETAISMKEIATRSGFQDEEHMRRAFRRRLNVLPQDYRARFCR